MHFAVALLPQIPEPLVMHLLVLGRGNEAGGRFRWSTGRLPWIFAPRGCGSGVARNGFELPSA
jgi:hypothetical protein